MEKYRDISDIWLEVRESNVAALHLYRRLLFKQVGIRSNYYPNQAGRENAIIMHREGFTGNG